MHSYVLPFREIDRTMRALAGGKGANLGELAKINEIHVPDGFCVSTDAWKEMAAETPLLNTLIDQFSALTLADTKEISDLSAQIRALIESAKIPDSIQTDVLRVLSELGEGDSYAVRSSATAEDLPTASFAGQQDTYLHIRGEENILTHISKCWASLFTDRAVMYRMQHGIDQRAVSLAVVIQKMILPDAAGILFTADPLSSNRKVLSIDASFGLGEALVSGIVNADNYKVRDGKIIEKKISKKELAIVASEEGGTKQQGIELDQQSTQTLTDAQILALEKIGRTIEAHFGSPQDIEWCVQNNTFFIVQSRPITTLFPIPERDDDKNHVYISVAHQQMMTDAMKPLGISFWQLTAARPMFTAGGRLFVDIAEQLATAAGRHMMVNVLGKSDPLIKGALTAVLAKEDFIPLQPEETAEPAPGARKGVLPPAASHEELESNPTIVADLMKSSEDSIAELKQNIQKKSGAEVIDFILEDMSVLKKFLTNPQSSGVFMAAMNAAEWINEKMNEWLHEKNASDVLSQSIPHNITSEMGLALLDVADAIRPYPKVIEYLEQVKDENFLDELDTVEGGKDTHAAFDSYLQKYGMRCAGEIDITKPRWSEKPTILIPLILSNIKNFAPGESARKFEKGKEEALKKEEEFLKRLAQLPDGEQKVAETKQKIHLLRNFIGYREYPKYGMVSRYFVYKQALLKEAAKLLQAHVIQDTEDMYYLTLQELHEVVRTQKADQSIIDSRKEHFAFYEKLTPPRVMTSEGEIMRGQYNQEHLPKGAIAGLAVSSGVVEGRARVIVKMEDADMEEGDILVTAFTDPSWTPLFLSIKGLVTEVGGMMTHGAVIAREYGLPAVVGVENATRLIKDGQKIRVNGTEGWVEVL